MHWMLYLLGVYLAICYGWGMYVLLRLALRRRAVGWPGRMMRALSGRSVYGAAHPARTMPAYDGAAGRSASASSASPALADGRQGFRGLRRSAIAR